MRQQGIPLFSLESRHPLAEFDWLGFSLPYELNYSNVLSMLSLAGIPLLASQRVGSRTWPLIIGGGTCTYNAEPMADFFDLLVIGEGEEVILELAELFHSLGRDQVGGTSKAGFLQHASCIEGVYVPALYAAEYHADGRVKATVPALAGVPATIKKRIVRQLLPLPERPVVPYVEAIHDRAMIEIMRGCTRGCRFCQAGMIYRPVRERPMPEVLSLADKLIASTGHEEIALVSLSSADYSWIEPVVGELNRRHGQQRISVSLPSLRTDTFSVRLAQMIQQTRKSGLTFAPEAGSERLRAVINKGVTAADLLQTAEMAFSGGWQRIKLYFMLGLPTETLDDVLAIADLVHSVQSVGRRARGQPVQISVSVNTFVPKPQTPFQWLPLAATADVLERQAALRQQLRNKGIKLSWSDEDSTWLEAALARGDRRMSAVVLKAWQLGARFDAWNEWYRPELWRQAFAEQGLDPHFYSSRLRSREECLPWAHIDTGVSPTFLWDEYQRALRAESSVNCAEGCLDCGVRRSFGLAECPVPSVDQ